jgi:hypothetical protein
MEVLNEHLMEAFHLVSRPHVRPLGPTAGCGKPHVRWCGRGDGRNPVTSTRSGDRDN